MRTEGTWTGKEDGSTISAPRRRARHRAILLAGLGVAIGCTGANGGNGAAESPGVDTTGTVLAELTISPTHAVRFLELDAGHVVTLEVGVEGEAPLRSDLMRGTPTDIYRAVARTIGANEAPPALLAEAAARPAAILSTAAEASPPPGSREATVGGPAQPSAALRPAAAPNSADGTELVQSALIDYTADATWFTQTFCRLSGDEVWCPTNTAWAHSGIIRTGFFQTTCFAASQTAGANMTIERWTGSAWVVDAKAPLLPRQWGQYTDRSISTRQSLCDGVAPDQHVDLTWIITWATPTFTGPVDVVANVKNWWTNDLEGFTHDDSFWYFTAAPQHIWSGLDVWTSTNPVPVYWSFPLSVSLTRAPAAGDCTTQILMTGGCDDIMPSPSSLPGRYTLSPWWGLYNHFGDPTTSASPPRLYIPMEASGGSATVPAVGVFDISTRGSPVPIRYMPLPASSPQTELPWIAYNAMDNFFYSTAFNNATALQVYSPNNNNCASPPCGLVYLGSVPLVDGNGNPITLQGIQGGKFSTKPSCVWSSCADDRGKLYLSYAGGFYIVDPDYHQWDPTVNAFRKKAMVRVPVAANVSGDNEIEGLDVLNGHVLLMMINNNVLSNDGFYLKDYTLTAGSEL